MRHKLFTAITILIFIITSFALVSAEIPKINIKLDYGSSSIFDSDKDGIETDNSVISFTVKDTEFNWHVNKRNLCTKWEIFSIDNNKITVTCHGSELCCNFIGLKPAMQNWDDNLYLTYGEYGTSLNNKVNAKVIYVDYKLNIENPYSRIYYSDYDYLYAVFLDKDYFDGKSVSNNNYGIVEKLERIKTKNKLSKISLTDDNGNPVLDNLDNKNLKLKFFMGNGNKNYRYTTSTDDEIIAITNFEEKEINWDKLEQIFIEKENKNLGEHIKKIELIPRKTITVNGIGEILEENSYEGYVKISTRGLLYNRVLHCSDDLECNELKECSTNYNNCYLKNKDSLEIYIPHFSSVVLALNESDINLNIIIPEQNSILESGENIYLNFTTNLSISANYSLDDNSEIGLGDNTIFSDLLEGILPYNTLQNGAHNITINLMDNKSNIAQYNFSFNVNDNKFPELDLTCNLLDVNNSLIVDLDNEKEFSVKSNEYAKISYRLNSNPYSGVIDLGIDKIYNLNLTLDEGINTLSINTTDLHGNNLIYDFTFNFSYAASCSDGIKNGDETGIDCGGPCSACIEFNVTTNKPVYEFGENIILNISSRANSAVNLTVFFGDYIVDSKSITGYSPDYPIFMTTVLDNITSAGAYTINATSDYMDNIDNKIIYFYVNPPSNTLSVNINANATTVNEGDTIKFSSTVTCYTGTLSYRWDFGNDGSIDSYSTEVTKTYSTNGTYTVNLTITDDTNTASDIETIVVRKVFNVTITVKNDSGNIVKDADVEFNDIHKNASDDGKASFLVNSGTYELRVKNNNYLTYYNNSVEINSNKDIEVKLKYDENNYEEPKITLISPDQNKKINSNTIEIIYKVEDESEVNCSLQLNEYKDWWIEKGSHKNPERNKEKTFTLSELKDGEYKYKIKCIDKYENIGFSDTRSFYVEINSLSSTSTAEMTEQDKDINSIIDKINSLLTEFEKLAKPEREVFESLEIQKKLDNAKTELSRYKRDLNNLIWRRLNETELKEAEIDIYDKIENLKDEIPTSLNVIDSTEFVAYPKNEDIENITLTYLNSKNKKYSKRQEANIIKNNKELQSLLTVTTKAKIVEIEYLSSRKEKITLIEKELKIDESSTGLILIEYIPKEIAKDVNEIEFLFDYETILDDPLISINIGKLDHFTYYFRKEINLEDAKKTKSILINEEEVPRGNQITGFSVLTNLKPGFINSSNTRILIEVLIIIVLSLVYIGYSVKGTKIRYYLTDRSSLKNLNEIKRFIESAKNELGNNNYYEAKSIYKNINSIFKGLPGDMKKEVYKNIIVLSNKLDLFYINKLLDKAEFNIQNKNRAAAISDYNKITGLYKRVPLEYKSQVLRKCNELRLSLSGKNAN